MNSRDVRDESIVDSLLCLLLDLFGNASQNYKMSSRLVFCVLSIFGIEHNLRSLTLHIVPFRRCEEHEFSESRCGTGL